MDYQIIYFFAFLGSYIFSPTPTLTKNTQSFSEDEEIIHDSVCNDRVFDDLAFT